MTSPASRLFLSLIVWLSAAHALARPMPGRSLSDNRPAVSASPQDYSDVLQYIASAWKTLRRSTTDCESLVDPKVHERPVLYLPADFPELASVVELQTKCNVDVERLPAVIHHIGDVDGSKLKPGLLYLPNPYVVPGGIFNEMYGWDSYFIIRGLLRDGELEMARGMATTSASASDRSAPPRITSQPLVLTVCSSRRNSISPGSAANWARARAPANGNQRRRRAVA